jgi:hypothetical protein
LAAEAAKCSFAGFRLVALRVGLSGLVVLRVRLGFHAEDAVPILADPRSGRSGEVDAVAARV